MEQIQRGGRRVSGFGVGAPDPVGTRPSPFLITADDLSDYQTNLIARMNRIDATIVNCPALEATTRAAWTAFRSQSSTNTTLTTPLAIMWTPMPGAWRLLQAIEATVLQYENVAHELCRYVLPTAPPTPPPFVGPGGSILDTGGTPGGGSGGGSGTPGGGSGSPSTWPYWLGGSVIAVAGAAVLVPIIKEVIAVRQLKRATQ